MFESKSLMFLYSVSPVHMGAGTALGAIDAPVQRERHTNYPMLAGSGIKGAFRHAATVAWNGREKDVVALFGPDPGAGDAEKRHAGSVSFGDGQLVLFPVRSLHEAYVYTTSPTALRRLRRLLELVDGASADLWEVPEPERDKGLATAGLADKAGGTLVLEAYEIPIAKSAEAERVAAFLAEHGLPHTKAFAAYQKLLRAQLVVLPDDVFRFFVENATVVEPHVRISDATGTAEKGGLFYVENVPPESLFCSLVMASQNRSTEESRVPKDAHGVLSFLAAKEQGFQDQVIQVGGDATMGRGLMGVHFYGIPQAK